MQEQLTIFSQDIVRQVKMSCQIPTLVNDILSRHIIEATAKRRGLEVSIEELQKSADDLRLKHNLLSRDITLTWLQRHSLSLDDFEEIAYAQVLSAKLAHDLFADRVDGFFADHYIDYTQAVIYELVLDDYNLAMELFYAIQEQELSFWEAVRQYCQDPMLRRTGGYRGSLKRSELKPELSAAVFAAQPPQTLKPLLIAKRTYLIFVEEIVQPQLDMNLSTNFV
jgi:parvulin-like peptidyl-prolyl isomerase